MEELQNVKVMPGANEVPVIIGDMSKSGATKLAAELRAAGHTVFSRAEAEQAGLLKP